MAEVLVSRDGDIATVTLSNPDCMNALDLAMGERLGSLSRELHDDESLRCIVVRGAGEQAESYACFDTEGYREGVEALLAKRKPGFRGR